MSVKPLHNEKELLIRTAEGSKKAFSRLFYAYHNPLGEFVLTLTRSPELAEEIVLDVFVKVWMEREKLPEIEKFTSYLFIVCRNYTLNCIQKIANDQKKQELYIRQAETISSEQGSESDSGSQLLIDRAIAQLPPRQQEVFMLRMEGMKNKEIASHLGISPGSVKKYQQWAVRSVTLFVKSHAALSAAFFILP